MTTNNHIKSQGSYIFVNTNFRRNNEPIFLLASLESKRRISILNLDELIIRNKEEIFEYLGNIIKNHYKKNRGKLDIWGKIVNYQVHLKEDLYLFDTNGSYLENMVSIKENCATISLK